MPRLLSDKNLELLIVAVICGIGFVLFPSGEDWFPLDLDSPEAIYFDRNSLSWNKNVVSLSLKMINKDGTPLRNWGVHIAGSDPRGVKLESLLDCQQRRMRLLNAFAFIREGEYSKVAVKEGNVTNWVLDSSHKGDQKFIGLCDSERPGWHPFRYGWVRQFFPSLKIKTA